MRTKNNKVILGKFRLGENAFPSSKEKREKIESEIASINKKIASIRKQKSKE